MWTPRPDLLKKIQIPVEWAEEGLPWGLLSNEVLNEV
jgi:hypothetical protein